MALSTDPIDLLLDASGDLVITTDLQFSTGITAVVQAARIALQSVKGEWFLNDDNGVPYWERDNVPTAEALFGQPFDRLKALAAFREALDKVPNTTIKTLTVAFDNKSRGLSVSFALTTVFGDTDLSTLIVATGAT